jgi:hypothetical protein
MSDKAERNSLKQILTRSVIKSLFLKNKKGLSKVKRRLYNQAQSNQSAKLFLQSSELELPHPSHAGECGSPPLVPGGGGGGERALACGRGRVLIPTRGHKLWHSVFICTLCNQISPCHILAIDGENLIAGHEFVHTRTTGRHKSRDTYSTCTFKNSVQRADFRLPGNSSLVVFAPIDGAAT